MEAMPTINQSQRPSKGSVIAIQLWLALFGIGLSLLFCKSVFFNIVFNHLIHFQWNFFSYLLIGTGAVGLTSFFPKPFNLWDKLQDWCRQHKLSATLIVLGVMMLNPTFTTLMVITSYMLESKFGHLLTLGSNAISSIGSHVIAFFAFIGGLKNPNEFVKGIWQNLGKVLAVTTGFASAIYFYTLSRWALDPILMNVSIAVASALDGLGNAIGAWFSGGFVANFVLDILATSLLYTNSVLLPLSIVMVGGISAGFVYDHRFEIAQAIDRRLDPCKAFIAGGYQMISNWLSYPFRQSHVAQSSQTQAGANKTKPQANQPPCEPKATNRPVNKENVGSSTEVDSQTEETIHSKSNTIIYLAKYHQQPQGKELGSNNSSHSNDNGASATPKCG